MALMLEEIEHGGYAVELQREAVRRMRDLCVIRRRHGDVFDRTTMVLTPQWQTIYAGPCRFRSRAISGHSTTDASLVGGVEWAINQTELHLPATTILATEAENGAVTVEGDPQAVRVGDLCAVTGVGPVTQASLLGTTHSISGAPAASWSTARRFQVNQVL